MYSIILLLVDVSYMIIPWGGRMVIKLYTHKIMLAILNIIHLAIFYHNLIKVKLRYFRFKIWIFSCILIQSSSSKRDMKSIDMSRTSSPLKMHGTWTGICTEFKNKKQNQCLDFIFSEKIANQNDFVSLFSPIAIECQCNFP